jgi:4-alpha-glucanotransferase
MLPLGPAGAGHSPYQCFSAFAGNPNLISPGVLLEEGLLEAGDLTPPRFPTSHVDYPRVTAFKDRLLQRAWERMGGDAGASRTLREPFAEFRSHEAHWLEDFALFAALREAHGGTSWTEWPKELVWRDASAIASARKALADRIGFQRFIQFLFFRQLDALRHYASSKGVRMIGDIPIFVSPDSSDVWASPELFLLNRNHRPKVVAGVPPDYFSKTGQRWGNPLYDWNAMAKDRFEWWVRRARTALRQADLVRIDHFRGFAASWHIPAHQPTAERGRWVRAPGRELFERLREALGGALPFVAEDLGLITPDVEALRDAFGLPGMRVLQFAFGGDANNPFLPHNYVRNAVAYTGTHDNDTTVGWFKSLGAAERDAIERYAPGAKRDVAWSMIRLGWSSVARIAIAPLQDVLRSPSAARMNTPGNGDGNWRWRMPTDAPRDEVLDRLGELTQAYGRQPVAPPDGANERSSSVRRSPRKRATRSPRDGQTPAR